MICGFLPHDTFRAAEFMIGTVIIGRTIYDVSSAMDIRQNITFQETIPFCGRVEELSKLRILPGWYPVLCGQ